MDELERFYAAIGSDLKPVLERFGGNAEMTKRFIKKFVLDDSFENLTETLENNKTEDAFRAAHTLKGICLSLGFEKLFEKASYVTESLHSGDLNGGKTGFAELKEEYIRVCNAVNTLLNS